MFVHEKPPSTAMEGVATKLYALFSHFPKNDEKFICLCLSLEGEENYRASRIALNLSWRTPKINHLPR
jgi:hypothetical protein